LARGGGGFGGGGGGGGFRGGGFRGGRGSFRVGSVRSSGRPFGRTGARRFTSGSPQGSRYHGRHHHNYYGGYYRPWYRRHYWWWGYPHRPYYYAPVYWGGGIFLFIIALLIIIPLIGLFTVPYPFTEASAEGTVTYRDTQTLYFNEYWYEKEYMRQGSTIKYEMQAQSEVTFLIWDQPFDKFPISGASKSGAYRENITVYGNDDYQYVGYFLQTGSSIDFEFTVSGGSIEFFIADANDLNRWNNWEDITPKDSYIGSVGYSGRFVAPYTQDWYLVWYNSGSSTIDIYLDLSYTVLAFDFSAADVIHENVLSVPQDEFIVTESGDYYFFIYMDPFVNPKLTVDITFDVSYDTEVTHNDKEVPQKKVKKQLLKRLLLRLHLLLL
jgi:hypothetical protein